MTSLHESGWRQGSIFVATLTTRSIDADAGQVAGVESVFDQWVVASQDCDLANTDCDSEEPTIEIRPAHRGNPETGWGIRSKSLRLSSEFFTAANDPRLMISGRALQSFAESREDEIDGGRAVAFKTWLGRRYDRPAVPTNLVPLARAIAASIKNTRTTARAEAVHDVLFQAEFGSPSRYVLYAVVADTSLTEDIRSWMAEAALAVDATLGIMSEAPQVVAKDELSLDVLEASWSADLSDLSWTRSGTTRGAI